MADASKIGTPWQDAELDAIVEDYFDMLAAELAGLSYVKVRHSEALMAKIGRTHRSVEFKHQNISAVLDEIGSPWIAGYKPKRNYQQAIFGAIDRYLTRNPAALEFTPSVSRPPNMGTAALFVAPPPLCRQNESIPEQLQTLVNKFDPVERDRRNRALGKAGEEFVIRFERQRLTEEDRPDLAKEVRWVAQEDGDGAGYDVLSFDVAGNERLIEVKTTTGSARTPFFLSRNEYRVAAENPVAWILYRVHLFATNAHIFTIAPPLENGLRLQPVTWQASF